MAWIESHQELSRHPKTKKLARKLNISVPSVIGHLHLLWWWAMDYTEEGGLSQYEFDDIADAMLWDGDSDTLISSLVEVGFLDQIDDGLHIHDWEEYAGRLIDQRKSNAERKRMSRARHKDVPKDGKGSHGATVPNLTIPNLTEHKEQILSDSDESNETQNSIPEKIPYAEIVNHLNLMTKQSYRSNSKATQSHIRARWNEGFRVDDFKIVIDKKTKHWLNDPKNAQYLRPETLFGTKFESYLNAPDVVAFINKNDQRDPPKDPKLWETLKQVQQGGLFNDKR